MTSTPGLGQRNSTIIDRVEYFFSLEEIYGCCSYVRSSTESEYMAGM